MSRKEDIDKAKKSKIFPEEHLDYYSENVGEIYKKQDEEINDTKEKIKKNFIFNDGEDTILMFFS